MIRSCQAGRAFKMKSTPIKEQQVQRPRGRQEPGVLKGWCGWSIGPSVWEREMCLQR